MKGVALDISEARKQLTRIDERLKEDRIIWVTRHNKRAFACVDIAWMETILETLAVLDDPATFKMLNESLEDIRHGRVYDHDDLDKVLG